MKPFVSIFLIFAAFISLSCQPSVKKNPVYFGDEILLKENLELLKGKRIGVVTNHSAILPNGVHLVDSLISLEVNIQALFSPEHGIRGEMSDGVNIASLIDIKTGIQVYSLYGKTKIPSFEMLEDIDIILLDIQDIGARFYTYISTLYYVLQSATVNSIPVVVLDRLNPISGIRVEGPILDPMFKSFIGIATIPVVHGMTIGELTNYFSNDILMENDKEPDFKVIKMKGWNRNNYWDDLNREWIPTSPNIPKFETALVYPGTCFIEGTNVSEGRGTDNPFLTIGAPFINSEDLINELRSLKIFGVDISAASFTPVDVKGKAVNPKYEGILCNGLMMNVTDKKSFNAVRFGIKLIYALLKLYPDDFRFRTEHFDLLAGSSNLREDLLSGKIPSEIISSWQIELDKFKTNRAKYLLY
jgi:uncharacterized protein YbbC (DUF1343 family)